MIVVTPDQEPVSIASRPYRPIVDRSVAVSRRNDDWLSKVESGEWTTAELAAAHGLTLRAIQHALSCARQQREQAVDGIREEADRIRA